MRRATLAWRIPGLLLVAALALAGMRPGVVHAAQADPSTVTVNIDRPPQDATGSLRLHITGWAADPTAATGTGVDRVEAYLDAPRDAGGTFLARATYGESRPDVARALGADRFTRRG